MKVNIDESNTLRANHQHDTVSPTSGDGDAVDVVDHDSHIVGGWNVTSDHQYPWMASIHNSAMPFCGASLIAPDIVLTAAHCEVQPWNFVHVKGAHGLLPTSGHRHNIKRVINHPLYNSATLDNDVAILVLETASTVTPVDVTTGSSVASSFFAIGWGRTSEGGPVAKTLQEVIIPFVPFDKCNENHNHALTDRMMCAGLDSGLMDSCEGDSGGPLLNIRGDTIMGVVSWGKGCARRGKPGVYARIDRFVDWINEIKDKHNGIQSGTCTDVIGWHDADSPTFDCDWYSVGNRCADFGDGAENNGHTANTACCACKAPSCTDVADWHDNSGPHFDCDWYSQGDRCAAFGHGFSNDGHTANTACCACKNRAMRSGLTRALAPATDSNGSTFCSCKGTGFGDYDICTIDGPDEVGYCLINESGPDTPKCVAPPGTQLKYSTYYNAHFLEGCMPTPRMPDDTSNAVPFHSLSLEGTSDPGMVQNGSGGSISDETLKIIAGVMGGLALLFLLISVWLGIKMKSYKNKAKELENQYAPNKA